MYLVDASILIDAKNRYYAFDIAPGFWDWLDTAHQRAGLISIDAVRDELMAGEDELAECARARREFFLPVDQFTVQHFAPLSKWAAGQNYRPAALREFSSDRADFLLIAHAAGHGDVVVTNELPRLDSRKRVKIPDACLAMNVETIDIFAVLTLHGGGEAVASELAAPTIPGLD